MNSVRLELELVFSAKPQSRDIEFLFFIFIFRWHFERREKRQQYLPMVTASNEYDIYIGKSSIMMQQRKLIRSSDAIATKERSTEGRLHWIF